MSVSEQVCIVYMVYANMTHLTKSNRGCFRKNKLKLKNPLSKLNGIFQTNKHIWYYQNKYHLRSLIQTHPNKHIYRLVCDLKLWKLYIKNLVFQSISVATPKTT